MITSGLKYTIMIYSVYQPLNLQVLRIVYVQLAFPLDLQSQSSYVVCASAEMNVTCISAICASMNGLIQLSLIYDLCWYGCNHITKVHALVMSN